MKIMDSDDEESKIVEPKQAPAKEQPKQPEGEIIIKAGKKGKGRQKQQTIELKGAFY